MASLCESGNEPAGSLKAIMLGIGNQLPDFKESDMIIMQQQMCSLCDWLGREPCYVYVIRRNKASAVITEEVLNTACRRVVTTVNKALT
ncbi:hypothetical protein ANN_07164 [Periplaneta americana]|uniref:Uncharacterized protein n=1 Tax=Periplaneta americana TaxID=6978 RepID=A0ABQ8TFL4_PERAM|nr:hypothetical protein ANN_07164 [Periplaneta americana]